MKYLILLFTLLSMLAIQAFAQQHAGHHFTVDQNINMHSTMPNNIFDGPNHNLQSPPGFEGHSAPLQKTDVDIRIDSVFIQLESGNYLKKFTYNENGDLVLELLLVSENGLWVNDRVYSYTYDVNGFLLTYLSQKWEDNNWVNAYRNKYTYDNAGNKITTLGQNWIGNAFVNQSLTTITFDSNGQLASYLFQGWENDEWLNYSLYTYTHNYLGKPETLLFQEWENDEWKDISMYFYTYNTSGEMLTQLFLTNMFGEWYNVSLHSYSYNMEGQLTSDSLQDWDEVEGVWVDQMTASLTYDISGNWNSWLRQFWGFPWFDSYLNTRTFDLNGNLTMELKQLLSEDSLVNSTKKEYTFLPGEVIATAYDWIGGQWIESLTNEPLDIFLGGDRVFSDHSKGLEFYYTDVTGIEEQDAIMENEVFHCFPNPATDQLNIEINPAWQAESCVVELFNQAGLKVKSFEFASSMNMQNFSFDVAYLQPGMYFLWISSDLSTSTQKLIISK